MTIAVVIVTHSSLFVQRQANERRAMCLTGHESHVNLLVSCVHIICSSSFVDVRLAISTFCLLCSIDTLLTTKPRSHRQCQSIDKDTDKSVLDTHELRFSLRPYHERLVNANARVCRSLDTRCLLSVQ
jgi:hypothetical protein